VSQFHTPYVTYDVLDKWDSPSWNEQTREVIGKRLHEVPERKFLTQEQWSLLEAICARLIPQPDREEPIPIVPWIDDMLQRNHGPGYRYADMPPMRQAWSRGLDAIDAEARKRYGRSFVTLAGSDQDSLLRAVQYGEVECDEWRSLPPKRFFKSLLLKQAVSTYYAHPAAWSEMGFGGPASPRGYVRLGFDERDPWEAKEVEPADA
jgi:Gluconate 2-dehydrogenase subunit 3